MARPIRPDSRGVAYWNHLIVMMGRLKSSMLIDTLTDEELAQETGDAADKLVQLAQRHKVALSKRSPQ